MTILPGIDLGKGERGERRRAALEQLAHVASCYHGGNPSIGRWLCKQADMRIEAQRGLRDRLPIIQIVDARVVRRDDLNVSYINNTVLNIGYETVATLQYDNKQVEVKTIGALDIGKQTISCCLRICENKKAELLKMKSGTPGEIRQAAPGLDGLNALSEFGIPLPPTQRRPTRAEQIEFRKRTGKGYIYLQNEIYTEWATEYNQWIIDNPDLAMDYNCQVQNENWIPVK